jgi:hypothetical protein
VPRACCDDAGAPRLHDQRHATYGRAFTPLGKLFDGDALMWVDAMLDNAALKDLLGKKW